jgi:uncharacterized protein (DUF362 family)/Pyruvate/2-oxoacid:ferredoxin oxidoreductase delta subunit
MRALTSIVQCEDYHQEKVLEKVEESITLLGGVHSFIKPGDRVLLKPNFLIGRKPEKCVNTHYSVVKAVARLALSAGAQPVIGDSPQMGSAYKVAEKCGIVSVAEEMGIDIVDFEPVEVKHTVGKFFKRFTVGKAVLEADVIINLPKLKTHSFTYLTLAVKNLFGCIPGQRKAQWHVKTAHQGITYFARMLLDLSTLIKPALSIVDGIVAMEGKGPGFGDPRKVGLIISGTNAVAVDAVISKLIGVPPEHYPVLNAALTDGYGFANLNDIVVRGKSISEAAIPDFILPPLITQPSFLRRTLMRILKGPLTTRPFIDKNTCLQCGNCFNACPVHCIVSHEDGFQITKQECIQCLCCMEVCPNGAVDLKDGFLLKLFSRKKK